jgi:predicted nucleotidyltransferase
LLFSLHKELDRFTFGEVIILEQIIEYIKRNYNPISIILYGSYADGTNNLNSDFDSLVISYDHEQFHDTSFVNGIQLDVFVYPVSYFEGEFDCDDFLQIFDGKIIVDSNERGKALQMKVISHMQNRPKKSKAEIDAISLFWTEKDIEMDGAKSPYCICSLQNST